ncbi:hypothetical protein G6F61_010542 [Rhizopus arrhizus]|nr:hypothetical protein G6F61_010542 [Rhizopus arrhizus]
MQHLDKSIAFSFLLRKSDQALKDVEVYHLYHSLLSDCEASLALWDKEVLDLRKDKAIILDFEYLLDSYLDLPTKKAAERIIKFIESNKHISSKEFSSRINLFNSVYYTDYAFLKIPNLESERLPTIQGVLKEIGKAKLQSFEVEINLMETCLWNKQTEIQLLTPRPVLEKSYHGDLNEILINMRIANFQYITQLTACLLSILPVDENTEHEKSIKNMIEMNWAQIYTEHLNNIVFESVHCPQSRSAHSFLKTAACLIAYRERFRLANISIFQRIWDHFYLQRSIYLKSITDTDKLELYQQDLQLLENAVFVSIASPIRIS